MSYALDNAMFQWSAGEARLREADAEDQAGPGARGGRGG